MKLAKLSLAIITSLALMLSVCLPVQASEESGSVDLSATVPLAISDVSASSIGYHGATISWKTNGDATSQVFYDTVSHDDIADYAYQTDEDTSLVSEHSIRLTGLSSGRTYHYRVRSATVIDDSDFIAISGDFTFRTSSPPEEEDEEEPSPIYYTDTNLFGIEDSFRISDEGEILETIEATSEDEMLTLAIEEGTIALDIEDEPLETLTACVDPSPPEPPEDAYLIGAYDFGPDGATFDPPITLTWSYDPETLPEDVDLVIAYYDEVNEEWVWVPCEVDTENNIITASVAHFTTFAIIVKVTPPAPAAFTVSSLAVSPAEVALGDEVSISLLVANTGGVEGSYTVVLKIDGFKEAEERVTITAGGSKTVSFSVTREEADSYTVTVDGLSDSFSVVAPVIIVPEEEEEEVVVVVPEEEEEEIVVAPPEEEVVPPAKPINWPVLGGVIAGVIIVALLIFFLIRRRRAY